MYFFDQPFQKKLKNLDPSYKMDLDFSDCFGREAQLMVEFHKTDLGVWGHL